MLSRRAEENAKSWWPHGRDMYLQYGLVQKKSTACVVCGLLLYNSLNKNFVVFATHQQKQPLQFV